MILLTNPLIYIFEEMYLVKQLKLKTRTYTNNAKKNK
jgi:hypothetical protein